MTGNAMDDRRRCTAKSKQSGEQCKRFATPGGKTCVMHGSSTRKAKAAAARRLEQEAAVAAVATLGLPREIDPGTALLEEVCRTAGIVAWLDAKVRALDEDSLTWGVTRVKDDGDDRGTTSEAKPNIWYQLLVDERKHLVSVCTATLKAGVDERRVRLAEQQGDLLVAVIEGILGDLRLSSAQQKLVPTVVPRHLRAVAGA